MCRIIRHLESGMVSEPQMYEVARTLGIPQPLSWGTRGPALNAILRQRRRGAGGALRQTPQGDQRQQPREVVRATRRRQRPHVLQPKIGGDLVNLPSPGSVRGVRQPAQSWDLQLYPRQCRVSVAEPWRSLPVFVGHIANGRVNLWLRYASSQLAWRPLPRCQRRLGRQDHGPLLVNLQRHRAHILCPNVG
jgi:hypothetical protein